MRVLTFVFLTLMFFTPSLMASAMWDISDEEIRESQQRMAELVNAIEELKIEEIERLHAPKKDRHICLAGEFRSMKAAVAKMLDHARLSPNKIYMGGNDEPMRKSLRVMIMESSLNEQDKTAYLLSWIHQCYTMPELMEFLNFYANAELKYLSRITPTQDMPQDERELGMHLSRCYLSHGEEFTKHCTAMADNIVFGELRKSPKITRAHELLSHYNSNEGAQSSNQNNYSEDYIRMNFREGQNIN
ncbi:MAG: hypothetical protein K2X53_05980 [Alphaproteobacteria bacterium]|nr:hypothetical protein [Alphaproteobacteria bacterium]